MKKSVFGASERQQIQLFQTINQGRLVMVRIFLASLLLILSGIIFAQTPAEWLWLAQGGGTGNEYGYSISHDSSGNSYITGLFNGTAVFGTTTLTSAGSQDIFVAKLDTSGNWLWAARAGGVYLDCSKGISTDSSGNCYITGFFQSSATFGTVPLTSSGWEDIFIAKLDSNGQWLWAIKTGGMDIDEGYSISTDNNGNSYVTGYFLLSADFGTSNLSSAGGTDLYVAKLDSDGNWLWAKRAGGPSNDVGYGVCVDNSGNCIITGDFLGTSSFGTINLISSGFSEDIFIAKLDTNGNWLWASQAGGANNDDGVSISADSNGNILATGAFQVSANFGTTTLSSNGSEDTFVAKLDASGNWLWAVRAGGEAVSSNNTDSGTCISTDGSGNSFITGYIYIGTADFGATLLISSGTWDGFIAKLDANGNWVWAMRAGGAGNDAGWGISTDDIGNSYLIGAFSLESDFGATILTSLGERDVVVAKLSPGDVENDDDTVPSVSALSHLYDAYPNPFYPGETVNIKTHVTDRESGTLSIYNLRGQLIQANELSPGTHETSIDSQGLASGVYLYRLKTPTVNTVKKLVLLR